MSADERANARAIERQLRFVGRPRLEEYREKYARYFALDRQDGILQARMHTGGGPVAYGLNLHNAWTQLWLDIGNDPDNEVLILTGTGDKWIGGLETEFPSDGHVTEAFSKMTADVFYDQLYLDATKVLEGFIFNIEIPTIACINGPGFHTDLALLCDITLCSEHAELFDPHFANHVVPGDGQGLTFQELMGIKRAAYYLYTSEKITAEAAKGMGLVNEVLPPDELLPRAWEIAGLVRQRPRHVRRFTSALLRRQWKRRLIDDLAFHVSHEMLGIKLGG